MKIHDPQSFMVKKNFYRSQSMTNLINMYNNKAKYSAYGEIIKPAMFQSIKSKVAVIPPNRKLFTSTRTININEISKEKEKSTYEVLLKKVQIPFSVFDEKKGKHKMKYDDIYKTKKVKIENLLINKRMDDGHASDDIKCMSEKNEHLEHSIFTHGQSKRLWNELYKILDTSDVIVHVLDARFPAVFLSKQVINYVKNNEHKNLILVLNKVDLVPTFVTRKHLDAFSKHYPTVAMHCKSLSNHYGKTNLINLLKQYKKIHKREISVGFVGYPNTGKSSLINILLNKKSAKTAPLAGETKYWQQVRLDRGIYLFDSPGITERHGDTAYSPVLMGAVRVEKIKNPEVHVAELIKMAKDGLEKKYDIKIHDCDTFIEQLALRTGKVGKNGETNNHLVCKMVLNDWVQGKIQFWSETTNLDL